METKLSNRPAPAEAFMKEGRYDDAVMTATQMLEALYRWLYKEVVPRMTQQEQQVVTTALDVRRKAIGELTLDEMIELFDEVHLLDIAERELERDFSFLGHAQSWRDLRSRAAHHHAKPGDKPVTAEEAEAFLSTVGLYFHQAGLVIQESLKPVESSAHELSLRVQVPWQKMADFVREVLLPLGNHTADIEVQVLFTARSKQGVDNATIQKLKTCLDQVGATILDQEQKHQSE